MHHCSPCALGIFETYSSPLSARCLLRAQMEVKKPIFTVCGTPTYVAPEILEEKGVHNSAPNFCFNLQCDIQILILEKLTCRFIFVLFVCINRTRERTSTCTESRTVYGYKLIVSSEFFLFDTNLQSKYSSHLKVKQFYDSLNQLWCQPRRLHSSFLCIDLNHMRRRAF